MPADPRFQTLRHLIGPKFVDDVKCPHIRIAEEAGDERHIGQGKTVSSHIEAVGLRNGG